MKNKLSELVDQLGKINRILKRLINKPIILTIVNQLVIMNCIFLFTMINII